MSATLGWPGDARGALCLTFDNLGEAAEVQLGAAPMPSGHGDHFTATRVLPSLLSELGSRGLRATFFVEGVNAILYPDSLEAIAAGGHELGYHAWCHEEWARLSAAEQAENLARGVDSWRELGLEPAGMRPPGGLLGGGGVEVLRDAGMAYASPAGRGVGTEGGIALLPFQWRHVDASCVLPPLAPAREQMTGSPDPVDPAGFAAALGRSLDSLASEGGYLTIVLHLAMLDWLGEDRLHSLLDRAALASEEGGLWVAPCAQVAQHVLAGPGSLENEALLDSTSWAT